MLFDVINRKKSSQNGGGGGIILTGRGPGDGPISGQLVAAAGRAVTGDGSTRAAVVAGAMLAVLAGILSIVWALYHFRPVFQNYTFYVFLQFFLQFSKKTLRFLRFIFKQYVRHKRNFAADLSK